MKLAIVFVALLGLQNLQAQDIFAVTPASPPVISPVTVPTPDEYLSFDLDSGTGSAITADIGDGCTFHGSAAFASDGQGGWAWSGAQNGDASCGTNFDGLNDFAIAACIKATDYGASGGLGWVLAKSSGTATNFSWNMRLNDFGGTNDRWDSAVHDSASGTDRFFASQDSMDPCVGTSTWCHVAVTFSGCTGMGCSAQLYLDGVADSGQTQPNDSTGTRVDDSAYSIYVGGINGSGFQFGGLIDDVKIWVTNVPNAAQIAADADACTARN